MVADKVWLGCMAVLLFAAVLATEGCPDDLGHAEDADAIEPSEVDAVRVVDAVPEATPETVAEVDAGPRVWETHYEPGLEIRDGIYVLRLKGSPYEMGVQHAELMYEQLLAGTEYIESSYMMLMELVARNQGYLPEAMAQSYPATIEECEGMASVLADDGWTMERCIVLAWGDVIVEFINDYMSGCSQFTLAGPATADGGLIHGRNMDWDEIDYLLEYPTVIVRHPTDRIPYVVIAYPGCVAPSSGINAAGLSIASNEANTENDQDRQGRSHLQMLAEILQTAESLEDARAFIESQDRMSAESYMIADGDAGTAAVFEMTASHRAVRELSDDGVVMLTNHYIEPEMVPYHVEYPDGASSKTRLQRLSQLLPPDGADTLYGTFDLESTVAVLRDNYNPYHDTMVPQDQFDEGGTIANNGCIHSMIFLPRQRAFYLAVGGIPIPLNDFVGFSLDELFSVPDASVPDPARLP